MNELPTNAGGDAIVFARDVPLLAEPDFRTAIQPFVGKPIDTALLNGIATAISTYARGHDRLIASVQIPNQDIAAGTLRLVVGFGTYGELAFQGNRWFSSELLEKRLGIKSGDEIRLSTLEEAVNWVNTNPFRRIKVLVNEIPNQPGKGNLVVGVQEVRPFRAAFSGDNTGNEVIGKQRYSASLQFGNIWGRDHQGSYQFLTTSKPEVYQGHAIDYRIPLPSRHFFQFSANYVLTQPTFGNGTLEQKGRTFAANLRYLVPSRGETNGREFYFGASFKRSNNNVDFVGFGEAIEVRADSNDTFQIFTGFSKLRRDKHGAWLLAASIYASPGNINSRNTDEAFEEARSAADSSYIYGTIALQRTLTLRPGWELSSRGILQRSTSNLLSNEQFAVGGSGSVRGYDENVYAGEDGFVFNNDLMLPPSSKKLPFLPKMQFPLETRFLGFLDIGKVEYHKRFGSDIVLAALASMGVGFRSSLGNNFSCSFDYGWQLMHVAPIGSQTKPPPLSSRGHLKVVLAF